MFVNIQDWVFAALNSTKLWKSFLENATMSALSRQVEKENLAEATVAVKVALIKAKNFEQFNSDKLCV